MTVAPPARSRNASATTRRPARVRLEASVRRAAVAGRHVRERRHATRDRAALRVLRCAPRSTRRSYSATSPSIVDDSHRAGGVGADLPDVDREDRAAGPLDPLDDLGLHGERPDEPVEVRDDDHVGLARLDELDGAAQPVALRERRAAGDVQLLDRVDELEPVALADRPDTLGLLARRHEPIAVAVADARDADDADGPTNGGTLGSRRRTPAPDFTLDSDTGETVTLSSLKGSPVVLYFYPKDDTPGCTAQACGIRDAWGEFEKAGAVVLGVSPDGEASHAKFREKYDLPFTLLADTEHAVAEEYGVWGEKSYAGKTYMGVDRSTFVIGADGKVAKVFRKVKPDEHADQVLEALRAGS